ncbi:MAG: magnesium transporter [Caulobacteraceae bacterium]|nr:magnesium transporter [Caulobacteraceae bacterium]
MLRVLRVGGGSEVIEPGEGWALPPDAVWLDLYNPTVQEDLAVEQAIGVSVPTKADMAEIEISSRLYRKGDALVMTVLLMRTEEDGVSANLPVTFVLTPRALVTVRYHQPKAIDSFLREALAGVPQCTHPLPVLLGLLEAIVDRTADKLELISTQVESIGSALLRQPRGRSFEPILRRLGRAQTANARARDSLITLGRMLGFAALLRLAAEENEAKERLVSLQRDVTSLTDHATYVTDNVTFLLDAAVGMISTEQNAVMKIFSIMAVVFLPPTLIGSIYGMNFTHMPELAWRGGYPLALGLMLLTAVGPLVYFRKKGWL